MTSTLAITPRAWARSAYLHGDLAPTASAAGAYIRVERACAIRGPALAVDWRRSAPLSTWCSVRPGW